MEQQTKHKPHEYLSSSQIGVPCCSTHHAHRTAHTVIQAGVEFSLSNEKGKQDKDRSLLWMVPLTYPHKGYCLPRCFTAFQARGEVLCCSLQNISTHYRERKLVGHNRMKLSTTHPHHAVEWSNENQTGIRENIFVTEKKHKLWQNITSKGGKQQSFSGSLPSSWWSNTMLLALRTSIAEYCTSRNAPWSWAVCDQYDVTGTCHRCTRKVLNSTHYPSNSPQKNKTKHKDE